MVESLPPTGRTRVAGRRASPPRGNPQLPATQLYRFQPRHLKTQFRGPRRRPKPVRTASVGVDCRPVSFPNCARQTGRVAMKRFAVAGVLAFGIAGIVAAV